MGDLADKNAVLLACILEQSHTTTVVPEAEKEGRNSHTCGRREEDQSHPQVEADNRDGHREINPKKNPPRNEKKDKLIEVVGKLEQIVCGASTARQRKEFFLGGQPLAKDTSPFTGIATFFVFLTNSRFLILQSTPDSKIRLSTWIIFKLIWISTEHLMKWHVGPSLSLN